MTRLLPFTPSPQHDEAPLNVLRRAATGNHHASTMRFAFALNPDLNHSIAVLGAVARNPERLRSTFEAMGLSQADTERVSYRRIGNARADDVAWNGLRIAVGDLQFRRSKICMTCYLEDGFASNQWDHVAAMACTKHQVLLDDACPCCRTVWTPVVDPLACGCDPRRMAALQQPCDSEVASVLDRIIKTADQAGLNVLSGVRSVLLSWRDFGIRLSRAVVANALWNLAAGRWPEISTTQPITHFLPIHPRVALAPLLTAPTADCAGAARNLLSRAAPDLMAENLDHIWWPSTTAMAVLGINRVPFKKLVQAGHLTPREDGRHSAAAINELLWNLTGSRDCEASMQSLSALRAGPNPESLASLITRIKTGDITSYCCPVDAGLVGLRCAPTHRQATTTVILGIRDVAQRLGTNTESVRGAIRLGWLDGTKGTLRSAVEWSVTSASMQVFEDLYVFASAIAKAHRVSALTIASRLRSVGLIPVSGPDVDGGVTYIFKRIALAEIDLASALTEPYRSPGGRKKNGVHQERAGGMPSKETAAILGISVRQLRDVVGAGWIAPAAVSQRRRVFAPAAIRELKRSLDEDFVPLAEAARQLGQTPAQFRSTWIRTGVVHAYRFADWTLIKWSDRGRMLETWSKVGSASSIGSHLKRPRWLCPNLTKMGELTSPCRLGAGTRHVRLYPRNAEKLKSYDLT